MTETDPPAMQRAASLVPLAALVAELGADIDDVLDGTGVSVGDLRPDVFIPYATYLAILDNAVRVTRHDDFGLLLGSRQTLAALGPLGRVMRHAATLGEALAEFAAFQIHNSSGGTVYLIRADRDAILGYGVYDPSMRASPHIHDVIVAVGSVAVGHDQLVNRLLVEQFVELLFARLAAHQLNPTTGSATPCTARACSEQRKVMTAARSPGATHFFGSASGIAARFGGVSMMLGSTQLTLMFCSRSSPAMASVMRITALFEAL